MRQCNALLVTVYHSAESTACCGSIHKVPIISTCIAAAVDRPQLSLRVLLRLLEPPTTQEVMSIRPWLDYVANETVTLSFAVFVHVC